MSMDCVSSFTVCLLFSQEAAALGLLDAENACQEMACADEPTDVG